jgi:uncharacterized membrane protein
MDIHAVVRLVGCVYYQKEGSEHIKTKQDTPTESFDIVKRKLNESDEKARPEDIDANVTESWYSTIVRRRSLRYADASKKQAVSYETLTKKLLRVQYVLVNINVV